MLGRIALAGPRGPPTKPKLPSRKRSRHARNAHRDDEQPLLLVAKVRCLAAARKQVLSRLSATKFDGLFERLFDGFDAAARVDRVRSECDRALKFKTALRARSTHAASSSSAPVHAGAEISFSAIHTPTRDSSSGQAPSAERSSFEIARRHARLPAHAAREVPD